MWRTAGWCRSRLRHCTVTREFQTLYQIEEQVRDALNRPLPGSDAHLTVAPRPRRGWHPGHIPPGARTAAALVLLYPLSDRPHLLLTVRADQLNQHAGQVSLPGGGVEVNETVQEAALRETEEEVGVDRQQVRLIGALSPIYIPVSHFALHPVVGVTDRHPELHPDAAEVWRVLETPLAELLSTAGPRRGYRWHENRLYKVPYFEVGGERVWGATAMILAELIALIGESVEHPWGRPEPDQLKI